jgi:hypothetical protein
MIPAKSGLKHHIYDISQQNRTAEVEVVKHRAKQHERSRRTPRYGKSQNKEAIATTETQHLCPSKIDPSNGSTKKP